MTTERTAIDFQCPHCGVSLSAPLSIAGQEGKCAECRRPFPVPGARHSSTQTAQEGVLSLRSRVIWVAAGLIGAVPLFVLLRRFAPAPKSFGCVMMLTGSWLLLLIFIELWLRRSRAEQSVASTSRTVHDILDGIPGSILLRDLTGAAGDVPFALITRNHGIFTVQVCDTGKKVVAQGDLLLVDGLPASDAAAESAAQNAVWFGTQIRTIAREDIWVHPILVFTNAEVEASEIVRGAIVTSRRHLSSVILGMRGSRATRSAWKYVSRHGTTL